MNVAVAPTKSSTKLVTSVVPQGSDLASLLVLLFINLCNSNIALFTKIFAHDLNFYISIVAGSDEVLTAVKN